MSHKRPTSYILTTILYLEEFYKFRQCQILSIWIIVCQLASLFSHWFRFDDWYCCCWFKFGLILSSGTYEFFIIIIFLHPLFYCCLLVKLYTLETEKLKPTYKRKYSDSIRIQGSRLLKQNSGSLSGIERFKMQLHILLSYLCARSRCT